MSDMELEMELKNHRLTKSQKRVLKILRERGQNGVTPKQLLDEVVNQANSLSIGYASVDLSS